MRRLAALLAFLLIPALSCADTLRIATFNTGLTREGPGLLLRDLERGSDDDIAAAVASIVATQPDVLVLQGIDWDMQLRALKAFEHLLAQSGAAYPHLFALQPNTGLATGLDMDGDGRTGGPRDAQGYGRFTGQDGLAILSRLPINTEQVQDFSQFLWKDMPQALLPAHKDGAPFPSQAARQVQRLSATAHWIVPLILPNGDVLSVMAFQATPPVFDGPEDSNGRRNHDEIRLWQLILNGRFGPPPQPPFVITGGANLDPDKGEGRRSAIRALLADRRLQDPQPNSAAAGPNTVEWEHVGRRRVDYVLPSAELEVIGSGVHWPAEAQADAPRHRLVWVDVVYPD